MFDADMAKGRLYPGNYAFDTRLRVSCENHCDRHAILKWNRHFKIECADEESASCWVTQQACITRDCPLTYEVLEEFSNTLDYSRILNSFVEQSTLMRVQLECGHRVEPRCQLCAPDAHDTDEPDNKSQDSQEMGTIRKSPSLLDDSNTDANSGPLDETPPLGIEPSSNESQNSNMAEALESRPKSPEKTSSTPGVVFDSRKAAKVTEEDDTSHILVQPTEPAKPNTPTQSEPVKEDDSQDNSLEELMAEITQEIETLRARREQQKQQRTLADLRRMLNHLREKVSDESAEIGDESPDIDDTADVSAAKSAQNAGVAEEEDTTEEPDPEPEDPDAWVITPSHAQQVWESEKKEKEATNENLDTLMDMIGLEPVKSKILQLKSLVATAQRQGVDPKKERFNSIFVGGPGTGKSTVAEIYAKLLVSFGLVNDEITMTTGGLLAHGGISKCESVIKDLGYYSPEGVIIINDAPEMLAKGRIVDFITSEMDRHEGKVIFIFTGEGKGMEDLLGQNPRLRSRAPFTFEFNNYNDIDLHQILKKELEDKFNRKLRVERGLNGLCMRIAIRRIGRGRGRPSFTNARDVQNALQRMVLRQAERLEERRRLGEVPDDFFMTMEDILGPPPEATLETSTAWNDLQDMVGLESVKQAVRALISRLETNYHRDLAELPPIECSLNRVLLGNPGTGKTTVAKYYGRILADLGLLSNGDVVVKTPSDFVGGYLGQSEDRTKTILESTRGKVLIIDEAYGLAGSSEENTQIDPYKAAVIDAIVGEVQNTPSEDRCVLLLGYKDQMEQMFQNVNPAFGRRFPLASAFTFEDYSASELEDIFDKKLVSQRLVTTEQGKEVAMRIIGQARHHRNYGNASEIDLLLDRAKELQQLRITQSSEQHDPSRLEPQDFDINYGRLDTAETSIRSLFSDFVGTESLLQSLEGYSRITQKCKSMCMDARDHIPFNFLFRGPSGTGKTTTARRMGQVFYEIGLLGTSEIVECSATGLVGEYVGQTGPKTQRLFDKALGKVLFIDEAYSLADSKFGHEALVEMINLLTQDKYRNKLVTILAGYDQHINRLLAINPGLNTRFPEVIQVRNLEPNHCRELFIQCLEKRKLDIDDINTGWVFDLLEGHFRTLSTISGWGNARDVEALAESVFRSMLRSDTPSPTMTVTEEILAAEIDQMISERRQRATDAKTGTDTEHRLRSYNTSAFPEQEKAYGTGYRKWPSDE
ncbi:P-loop containing nucleoside triphosphate hydrolase protein [Xylariaceae sp. FL1019]|nr:P-loop containing nucleoside triphosphate hydrolase protein [Xylariaceae sp. FL1019]